ncbi:hypothetical protein BC827DRAFT_1159487 [Russula dissimulans]|nr:hypothetical protein BC827DRAFT_1159487 [Russula dissimulans]
MDLRPVPPPLSNPNPITNPHSPPQGKPPDPEAAEIPSDNHHNNTLVNSYGSPAPEAAKSTQEIFLLETLKDARSPFEYSPGVPLDFDGGSMGGTIPMDTFNTACTMVVTALEKGYHPIQGWNALDINNWPKLTCALTAAIGRGYNLPHNRDLLGDTVLEVARSSATDHNPITPKNPTLFHRLATMLNQLEVDVSEVDDYCDWYLESKLKFERLAKKEVTTQVEESLRQWKADQIERRMAALETEIAEAVKERNHAFFFEAAASIGLHRTDRSSKRTVSGSIPRGRRTPSTPRRESLPRAAKDMPSPTLTPRGRPPAPMPPNSVHAANPSPSPQPRNTSAGKDVTDSTTPKPPNTGVPNGKADPHIAAIKAAIQQAIAPLVVRINALESKAMPPPQVRAISQVSRLTNAALPLQTRPHTTTMPEEEVPDAVETSRPATQNNRRKKTTDLNGTPAVATKIPARNPRDGGQKVTAPLSRTNLPSTITEVTVLRQGGLYDPNEELAIRLQPANAIIHEVQKNMAKAVPKPLPLKAGRWSVSPRSKGNFVFSFDGIIPFDHIMAYEHILLALLKGIIGVSHLRAAMQADGEMVRQSAQAATVHGVTVATSAMALQRSHHTDIAIALPLPLHGGRRPERDDRVQ